MRLVLEFSAITLAGSINNSWTGLLVGRFVLSNFSILFFEMSVQGFPKLQDREVKAVVLRAIC